MKTFSKHFYLTITITIAIFFGMAIKSKSQSTNTTRVIPIIKFEAVPITTAIDSFARQAEINFIIDPKLFPNQEPTVTFTWTNMTAKNALSRLLKEHNLILVEDTFTTVARITNTKQIKNVVDADLLGSDTNNPTHVVFWNKSLYESLDSLAKKLQPEIIIDPMIIDGEKNPSDDKIYDATTVHIDWSNLTPKQAIVALCENYNLIIVKNPATGIVQIKLK